MDAGAARKGVPVDGGEVNRVSRQCFDAVGQQLNPVVVVEHLEQLIFQLVNIHRQASFHRSMGKRGCIAHIITLSAKNGKSTRGM